LYYTPIFLFSLFYSLRSGAKQMPGITLAQAEAKLATWMDADDVVATGQAYSMGGRSLTRADAPEIRKNIDYWDKQVQRLSRSGISVRGATPS
jgi:hypothetical protein